MINAVSEIAMVLIVEVVKKLDQSNCKKSLCQDMQRLICIDAKPIVAFSKVNTPMHQCFYQSK